MKSSRDQGRTERHESSHGHAAYGRHDTVHRRSLPLRERAHAHQHQRTLIVGRPRRCPGLRRNVCVVDRRPHVPHVRRFKILRRKVERLIPQIPTPRRLVALIKRSHKCCQSQPPSDFIVRGRAVTRPNAVRRSSDTAFAASASSTLRAGAKPLPFGGWLRIVCGYALCTITAVGTCTASPAAIAPNSQ